MPTIVEYSAVKRPLNAYPTCIISPPFPSPCCQTHMEQIGAQEEDQGWPFFYTRCRLCGYTVRQFFPVHQDLLQTHVKTLIARRAHLDAVA